MRWQESEKEFQTALKNKFSVLEETEHDMDMYTLNDKISTTLIQSAVKAAVVKKIQNKFKISNGVKGLLKKKKYFQMQISSKQQIEYVELCKVIKKN